MLGIKVSIAALALVGGAVFSARPVAADDPEVSLSSAYVTPGSAERVAVQVEGMTDCASNEIVVSLMFPQPTDRGYGPTEQGLNISRTSVTVDSSGDFNVELGGPDTFPGNWHGYVTVEAPCVRFAAARFLARVFVRVPTTSPLAADLGVADRNAAVVVIPAAEVRLIPILGGEPYRTPYEKLSPVRPVDFQSRAACSAADASPTIAPSGDVVIEIPNESQCIGNASGVGLRVTNGGVDLLSNLRPESGWVTPVLLEWPAPDTAGATVVASTPSVPLAGGGPASASSAGDRSVSRAWPTAVLASSLLALLVGATSAAWLRVRRK